MMGIMHNRDGLYVQSMRVLPDDNAVVEPYVTQLLAVSGLMRKEFRFSKPITIFTGDNGAGKSTLMEALALRLDFDAFGGPRHGFTHRNGPQRTGTESQLSRILEVTTVQPLIVGGFFLRAETQSLLTENADKQEARAGRFHTNHEKSFQQRSHGQAVFELIGEYGHRGIVLFDEPEAGLSVVRQMALLAEIVHAAEAGTQFIIATHSPILTCIPGADVWEVSEAGLINIDAAETENVQAMREFCAAPHEIARFIVTGEEDDYPSSTTV